MQATYLEIVNNSGADWKITAVDIKKADWSGDNDPETQLKNKQIKDGNKLRVCLHLRAGATGYYTLILKNTANVKSNECLNIGVLQDLGTRDCYEEKTLYSTVGNHYASVQSVSWYKVQGEGRGTRSLYLRKADSNAKRSDTVQFYVLSDTHLKTSDEDNAAYCSTKIRDHMMASADFPQHRYTFIIGDLVNDPAGDAQDRYTDIWQCNINNYRPLLCDGYGNHDMQFMNGAHTDIADLIRKRNNIRRAAGLPGFVTNTVHSKPDASGLHYKWHLPLTSDGTTLNVHFYMLNLVPTAGFNSSRNRNSSCALEFLRDNLPKDKAGNPAKGEPIFLFHHYGFVDPNEDCTYWNEEQKLEYMSVIADYPLAGIFYGHWHYTRNDEKMRGTDAPNINLENNNAFCCGGVQDSEKLRYVKVRATFKDGKLAVEVDMVNSENNKVECLNSYTLDNLVPEKEC